MKSLLPYIKSSKVSSVLNDDTTLYGKIHLFDQNNETCWNTQQGQNQYIIIKFTQLVTIHQLIIQFQGGFTAKPMIISIGTNNNKQYIHNSTVQPIDSNNTQQFTLDNANNVNNIKLDFPDSTDLFGRICIYKLDIIGTVVNGT